MPDFYLKSQRITVSGGMIYDLLNSAVSMSMLCKQMDMAVDMAMKLHDIWPLLCSQMTPGPLLPLSLNIYLLISGHIGS